MIQNKIYLTRSIYNYCEKVTIILLKSKSAMKNKKLQEITKK